MKHFVVLKINLTFLFASGPERRRRCRRRRHGRQRGRQQDGRVLPRGGRDPREHRQDRAQRGGRQEEAQRHLVSAADRRK